MLIKDKFITLYVYVKCVINLCVVCLYELCVFRQPEKTQKRENIQTLKPLRARADGACKHYYSSNTIK